MTMLPKARHGAQLLRCGALALMTATFVPLAISSASASTIPGPVGFLGGWPGEYAVNQVNATEVTSQKTVFNVKWELGELAGPYVTAVNHATALTAWCANCNAIAIGFQVITTTVVTSIGSPVSNIIVAVKASEVYLADDGVVTVDASDQASVEMVDSSSQTGIVGTGASLVSFWQDGLVGLKATREITWKIRRTGAARYIYNSAYKA